MKIPCKNCTKVTPNLTGWEWRIDAPVNLFVSQIEKNPSTFNPLGGHVSASSSQVGLSEVEANLLDDILGRDPLAEISEQEKETLWRLRRQCMTKKYANILPRYVHVRDRREYQYRVEKADTKPFGISIGLDRGFF